MSAVAFSTAGFFVRSVSADAVTVLFWRNLFGGLILLPAALRYIRLSHLANKPTAVFIVVLSAIGSISYIAAFSYTSVANISIIYGAAPMMTAALGWVVLREYMTSRTLIAVLCAFAGVTLTSFGGGIGKGSLSGDGLALLMTLALSAVAVLSRRPSLPPLILSCASSLLAAVAIAPAHPVLALSTFQFLWLAAFGTVSMALALPCYLLALRFVPAGRAMLISALELPLGPFWVWAAYGETPSSHALSGGAIVCAAILLDLSAHPR